MLKPLRSERRRTLLRSSLFALAGAVLIAPLAFPPALPAQAGDEAPTSLAESADVRETSEPAVVIARDPFIPEVASGTSDNSGPNASGMVVQAVALGTSPRALVLAGSTSRIVGVGDALAGSKVSAIDAHGITLESGDTMTLAVPR
jgi:hypothetical protein